MLKLLLLKFNNNNQTKDKMHCFRNWGRTRMFREHKTHPGLRILTEKLREGMSWSGLED